MRTSFLLRAQRFAFFATVVLLTSCTVLWGRGRQAHLLRGRAHLDSCDSLIALTIKPESSTVRLRWLKLAGVDQWIILRATRADMSDETIVATLSDTTTWLETPAVVHNQGQNFYRVLAKWNRGSPENTLVIEDFEYPFDLQSYSANEDVEPDGWRMWFDGAPAPSTCLELTGNTWKREPIEPIALAAGARWRLSAKSVSVGDVQAFGIADSANEMWYGLWGGELRQSEAWNPIYQGYYPVGQWATMDLDVGADWFGRFGYYPRITSLLYANDMDNPNEPGDILFDNIEDISGAITLPPVARFTWHITRYPHPDSMEVAFCSMGCDPDGPLYLQRWAFGDGTYSTEPRPVHHYAAGRAFRVTLSVQDTARRCDWIVSDVADSHGVATQRITGLFTGDVMLARRYENDNGPGIIPTYGVNYIFSRVRSLVSSAEFAMCNLECPLTNAVQHHPTKAIWFKGRPEYVSALPYAGFDFASLANNHTFDYLDSGMVQTGFVVDSVGLLRAGCGENDELASQPVFYSKNGLCVAVVSFCNRDGTADNEQPYLDAGPSRPGFALWDRAHIETIIPQVRQQADVVIVQSHSGIEYATTPPPNLKMDETPEDDYVGTFNLLPDTGDVALRHYAIDMGADLVVNHHPHVLEGVEVYHHKLIAHSMGNFAFDQQYFETFPSMAVTTTLAPTDASHFVVHPIYIDRYLPTPATGELGGALLDYISDLSRPLRTWVVRANNDSAAIIMDTLLCSRSGQTYSEEFPLEARGSYMESGPFLMRGTGYPIWVSVTAPTGAQIRFGREQLWFGNMEAEGSTQWNLNSSYERYDTVTAYRGRRSMTQARAGAMSGVTTNLLWRMPISTSTDYTIAGWLSANNAASAYIQAAVFYNRSGGSSLLNVTAGSAQSGTFTWRYQWSDFNSTSSGYWGDVSVNISAPGLDSEQAWFDDVMLIKWEPWRSGTVTVPFPSNVDYVQVRAPQGSTTAQISYRREWVNNPFAAE